jgi:hypothetical protein
MTKAIGKAALSTGIDKATDNDALTSDNSMSQEE